METLITLLVVIALGFSIYLIYLRYPKDLWPVWSMIAVYLVLWAFYINATHSDVDTEVRRPTIISYQMCPDDLQCSQHQLYYKI